MNMQKRLLACAVTLSLTALAGCGSDPTASQDVGGDTQSETQDRVLVARAVDGYLAGATAFIDHNENGTLDAFEPRAVTDVDGFFSYNRITGTDYCAAPSSQHCLKAALAAEAEVLVRVTGGYDTTTGLPFKGTLSVRSREFDRADQRLVTPQTSMTADIGTSAHDQLDALVRAGVLSSTGSLEDDHIGSVLSAQAVRAQLATILARVFSSGAELAVPAASSDDEDSVETWHAGYAAMTNALISHRTSGGSGAFSEVFASLPSLTQALRQTAFAQKYPGQAMPLNWALANEAAAQPLLQFTAELVGLSEELIAKMQSGTTSHEQMRAVLRVLAVAAERGLNNPADAELADLFAWVRTRLAQGDGLGADLSALGAERVDLIALVDRNFDFDPNSNSISASAVVPLEAASAFAAIANTAFHVSVDDEDEQGTGLIFMVGESGTRAGTLKLCVRYRDDSGDFDTGSSSDPNGAMLVQGRWTLLNDFTLTMNADIAGGVRPLLVKSVGVSGDELKYRFDFGSDPSEWTGPAPTGFTPGSMPANDAECRNALLQRFGPVG